ncbi:WD40 repeat-like protein [Mycena galericulata]|nr:WD40 repeat-like protein [Mycena galericulata]
MSPASPSPTTPKPESHFKQRAKAFVRGIFKPSSLKPSASTPTLGVYPPGAGDAAAQGAQPRASLNDLTANEQQIVPSRAGATSLRVPEILPAGVTSVPVATVQITTPVSDESAAVVLTSEGSSRSTEEQVSPQSSALKKNVKLAWDGFKVVAKTAEGFLDGTPFKTPIAAFNKVIDTADAIIDNKESVAKQLSSIRERMEIVSRKLQAEDRANLKDIKPTLDRFAGTLENTEKMLKELNEAGFFERLVEHDELPKEIADIARQVDEATKNFQLELNLANFRQIHAVKTDTEVLRLDKLKPIQEVRHTSLQISSCAKGTREDIIKSIISWCKDTSYDIPGIYWLSGMAGTGKSTIAFTVCEQLHGDGKASRLAASFFCSRQSEAGRKRSNIMPTIAHDLALGLPRFRRALLDAQVDANPPALKYHLKDLLVDPWDISIDDREGLPPLVVVLDALDELENSDGSLFMEELIKIIAGHHDHLRGLKFLVTSRRDPRIVEIGNSLSKDTVYRLEEVPTTTIEHDINIYLRVSLPQLDPNQLRRLADQASGLFIYAATAVRFIVPQHASRHPPPNSVQKDRLEILLNSWPGESHRSAEGLLVDHLYEDILTRYILPMAKVDQKIAVAVLHTVLCTEEPIFVSDIPHLWGKNKMAQDTIGYVLEQLHSVLYTSSDRVYSYHKSFVDFMCTPARFANQELAVLCCLTPEAHFTLATSCFHLMTHLEFNMCNLPSSFLDDFEIKDLPEHVEKQISSALQYACRHWSAHLSRIPSGMQKQRIISEFKRWLYTRSLFWMEAMNLLKVIGECYPALLGVRQWLNMNMTTNERASQKDLILDLIAAENLVTIFGSTTISKSTPHLYLSALAATPRDSSLMRMWHRRFPAVPRAVALRNSGSQLLLLKHDDGVKSVCFSPDGLQAITGSKDNMVRIWDLSTGSELHTLEGHEDTVNSVSFLPDGLRAISGSDDNTVRIWDVSTGEQLHKLDGHDYAVNSVGFSPDGLHAISGSDDHTVRIWDVSTGEQLHKLDGHDYAVNSVGFSPDGLHAISGSDDHTVRIWDVSTGEQLHKLEGHEGSVNSVSFSPDGLRAISAGSWDKTVRIWDVSTGEQLHKLEGHEGSVNSVSFSPDGLRAISGSNDTTVRIWDVSTGEQLHKLEGHEYSVNSVSFSPDGLRAISASNDNTVRIWDVSTGEQPHKLEGHESTVNSVSFSPDGLCAISGSDDATVRIWDVVTGEQLHKLEGHESTVNSVSFSPDGLRAISASNDNTVRIWDVSTGEQLHKMEGHEYSVTSISFSPDGLRAISGSWDETVRIWDASTGEQLHKLEGHSDTMNLVSFSPDGLRAISGSADYTVRIWDVSTGGQLHKLEGHERIVNSVSFSPDGLRAISGSDDKTVRIWDVLTGEQLHKPEGHEYSVNSVSFSPDGLRAISASNDNTVRIWDVSTGEQLRKLEGHNDNVMSVSFSPDGLRAISGSWDQTVRIWNLPHLDPSTAEWHVSSTGWITNSSGERCMWISPEMRNVLHSPQCLVISARGSVKVSLGNTSFGPEWGKCYNPQA